MQSASMKKDVDAMVKWYNSFWWFLGQMNEAFFRTQGSGQEQICKNEKHSGEMIDY